MLTQAVFDKLWIMDAEVVGSELTDAYLELLTVEARLTLDEQATAERAAEDLRLAPASAPTTGVGRAATTSWATKTGWRS